MKATRLLHASVNVEGDLDACRRFYAEVLGLEEVARPEIPGVGGHWLGAGDGQVHLVDAPMAGHGVDPTGPHFCVAVADIDAAIAELDAAGVEYPRGAQGDVVQVWVTDPAGNTVELQQDG